MQSTENLSRFTSVYQKTVGISIIIYVINEVVMKNSKTTRWMN